MNNAEDAYTAYLAQYEDLMTLSADANEAQTRLQAIDVILFQVLDWQRHEVEVEKYCRAVGYADYVFVLNKKFPLLIEAKKTDTSFIIPEGIDAKQPRSFALLGQEAPGAKDAIVQALGYAASLGCRYISVSNGRQWIIAQTFVDAQTLDERTVIVFDSLLSIKENFRHFWNCFSKAGVVSNSVANMLLDVRVKAAPRKLSSEIPGYPVQSHRNVYANELNYILSTLWDYLSRSEHSSIFLQHCYVPSRNASDNIAYAKEALRLRYSADSVVFSDELKDGMQLYRQGESSGVEKPFIVLGEVGRGKSTFLDYLKFSCDRSELNNYIQVTVNFLDRPDTASEVSEFIYRDIENQLLNNYSVDIQDNDFVRGVLDLELKRYRRSTRYAAYAGRPEKQTEDELLFLSEKISQKHSYFKDVIHHLKRGQKRSLVLFFDNLDRRNSDIQESAFLKASSIARDWECVVFVCLRPDTFHDSQKRGLLDSVAPKVFSIGAVDLYLVLKKRFDYASVLMRK